MKGEEYNQLKSVVYINHSEHGQLSGSYKSIVGNADGAYNLTGFTNWGVSENSHSHAALAFVVLWNNEKKGNSHSVTAWSGQYKNTEEGVESLNMHWLLTRQTYEHSDWDSTMINIDHFARCDELILEAQQHNEL